MKNSDIIKILIVVVAILLVFNINFAKNKKAEKLEIDQLILTSGLIIKDPNDANNKIELKIKDGFVMINLFSKNANASMVLHEGKFCLTTEGQKSFINLKGKEPCDINLLSSAELPHKEVTITNSTEHKAVIENIIEKIEAPK